MCLLLHIYSKINFTDLFTLVILNVQGVYGDVECCGVRTIPFKCNYIKAYLQILCNIIVLKMIELYSIIKPLSFIVGYSKFYSITSILKIYIFLY